MSKIWRRDKGERGAILVMSTVGVVLAVVAAALAVDLGTLAQERRRDQKVADLAALDAIRHPVGEWNARANESAARNGFPSGPGYSVTAVEGIKNASGACEASPGLGKVCVTVISPHKNNFVPGNATIVARAVAGPKAEAGFKMGSSLASASIDDATNLPILNRVFGRFLAGPTGQANVLSYKGLADVGMTWGQLQSQLGFGTLNELMNANLTMGQLLTATGTILNNQGTAAAISAYNDIVRLQSTTTSTATFKLGEMLTVAQGSEDKAAAGTVNVFELITGSAELANKNTFIDAGAFVDIPVNLGPLGNHTLSTKLGLKVIEGPKWYYGPVNGTVIKTSQMEVTLTPHLDIDFTAPLYNILSLLSIIGNSNLQIVGDFPIKFTAAGALGTLEAIRCSNPNQGITVGVTSLPITTTASGNLSIALSTVLNILTGDIKVNVNIDEETSAQNIPGGPYHPEFAWSSDFTPPDPDGQTMPGAPVGVTLNQGNVTTTVGAAGLTELVGLLTGRLRLDGSGSVEAAILDPILNRVMNEVVAKYLTTPVLKALGVAVGPVDVWAPAEWFDPASCGQPGLLG